MGRLIWIEWKKLIFQRKFWFLLVGILMCSSYSIWQQKKMSAVVDMDVMESKAVETQILMQKISSRLQLSEDMLLHLEKGKADADEIRADYQKQMSDGYQLMAAYTAGDWRKALEIRNTVLQDKIQGRAQVQGEIAYPGENISLEQLREEIEKNSYCLEQDINPYQETSRITGGFGLIIYIQNLLPVLLPVVVLLLAADMISKERKEDTFRYLFQQPYSRLKILASKYTAAFAGSCIVLLVGAAAAFAVGTVFGGAGNMDFPVVSQGFIGKSFLCGEMAYQTRGGFLAGSLVYGAAGVLFYVLFGGLCSVYGRSELTTAAAVTIPYTLWVMDYMVQSRNLKKLVFLQTDIFRMMTGGDGYPQISMALIHMAAAGAVCVMITICRMQKIEG